MTIDFVWGTETEFTVRAILRTLIASLSSPTGGGTGDVDFASTIYWTGIQNVTTDGLEITDYDLITASNADYRNSFAPVTGVPEPATGLLLVVGLGFFLTKVRGHLKLGLSRGFGQFFA